VDSLAGLAYLEPGSSDEGAERRTVRSRVSDDFSINYGPSSVPHGASTTANTSFAIQTTVDRLELLRMQRGFVPPSPHGGISSPSACVPTRSRSDGPTPPPAYTPRHARPLYNLGQSPGSPDVPPGYVASRQPHTATSYATTHRPPMSIGHTSSHQPPMTASYTSSHQSPVTTGDASSHQSPVTTGDASSHQSPMTTGYASSRQSPITSGYASSHQYPTTTAYAGIHQPQAIAAPSIAHGYSNVASHTPSPTAQVPQGYPHSRQPFLNQQGVNQHPMLNTPGTSQSQRQPRAFQSHQGPSIPRPVHTLTSSAPRSSPRLSPHARSRIQDLLVSAATGSFLALGQSNPNTYPASSFVQLLADLEAVLTDELSFLLGPYADYLWDNA
jgi:hypothetical protein